MQNLDASKVFSGTLEKSAKSLDFLTKPRLEQQVVNEIDMTVKITLELSVQVFQVEYNIFCDTTHEDVTEFQPGVSAHEITSQSHYFGCGMKARANLDNINGTWLEFVIGLPLLQDFAVSVMSFTPDSEFLVHWTERAGKMTDLVLDYETPEGQMHKLCPVQMSFCGALLIPLPGTYVNLSITPFYDQHTGITYNHVDGLRPFIYLDANNTYSCDVDTTIVTIEFQFIGRYDEISVTSVPFRSSFNFKESENFMQLIQILSG